MFFIILKLDWLSFKYIQTGFLKKLLHAWNATLERLNSLSVLENLTQVKNKHVIHLYCVFVPAIILPPVNLFGSNLQY